jgi:hypothetical protein
VERKNMRDVNVGERERERERERREMRVKDLERKKRGKKGERERETYEKIQGMRKKKKKKVKKNNYLQVEFLGLDSVFVNVEEWRKRKIEVERKKMRDVNVGERERRGMRVKNLVEKKESVKRERKKGGEGEGNI